jgi:hypothetical protein
MQNIPSQLSRSVVLAGGFIVATWLFFAPIAGFHHIIACGILAPVVLNGEAPAQAGDYVWGEYAVRFFPWRFAVSLVLWLLTLFGLSRLLLRRHAHVDSITGS